MREKTIQLIVILIALLVGVLGTLYFTQNKSNVATTNKNVTITANDSINESVEKIYNAVVVVENYSGSQLSSTGSGFVYKTDSKYGYIMTNYHVVQESQNIKIVNTNGDEVEATYLGGDSYADLAIIRIDKDKVLAVASIGDSTKSKLGDTVFTVGTPVGSEYMGSVTKGIISGEGRTITVSSSAKGSYMMEVLQTDASINPGNSGGPLVNINGEVIGITSMKLVTSEIEGMGFAIPIEVAMTSSEDLEQGKTIQRPYIGVSLYDTSNSLFYNYQNNTNKDGITIAEVEKDSAAEKAGLKTGDTILEVDGTKVKSTAHFKFLLYKHNIGDSVKIKIKRDDKEQTITLKLTKAQGE